MSPAKKKVETQPALIVDQPPPAAPAEYASGNPMALIADAVEKGVAVDVIERLFDLKERWEKMEAKKAFDSAMQGFQSELPQIRKQRKGMHGTAYASYDDIMYVIRPLLNKHGLTVSFNSEQESGTLKMDCLVSGHGHTETSTAVLPIPKEMKVNDTQRMGAAFSYGRRYLIQNALNIIVTGEDRDADLLQGTDITYMTEDQIRRLEASIEALEDAKPGTKQQFTKLLVSIAGVDGLEAVPAQFYSQIEAKVKGRMKEAGLA